MKEIKQLETKYKFDSDKCSRLHEEVRALLEGKYKETLETTNRINEIIEEIEKSLELVEVEDVKRIKETEEEAKEYFGYDFIKEFELLKKDILKNNYTIFIHGTFIDNCESIKKNGLNYTSPDILATAIPFGEKIEYTELLNWPHREHKGLVILAISNDCLGAKINLQPLWKFDEENSNEYQNRYAINPDFIYGYIDVENRKIERNEEFSFSPNYDGLEYDISSKKIEKRIISSESVELVSSTYESNIEKLEDFEIKSINEIMDDLLYNLAIFKYDRLLDKESTDKTLFEIKKIQKELNELSIRKNLTNSDIDLANKKIIIEPSITTTNNDDLWNFPPLEEIPKGK